jgi:predicted SprT family Zn-dependent metalloprotease
MRTLLVNVLYIIVGILIIFGLTIAGYKIREWEDQTLYDKTYDFEMCMQSCEKVQSMGWSRFEFHCQCAEDSRRR